MTFLSIYLLITMMVSGQEPLPSSIVYEKQGDRCIYTISGVSIAEGLSERYVSQHLERACSIYPGGLELFLDEANGTIKIIGSDELFDLPDFVGWLSINLGALPYWDELVIRDLKSSDYVPDIYNIVFHDTLTSPDCRGQLFHSFEFDSKGQYCLRMFENSFSKEEYSVLEYRLNYWNGRYSLSKNCEKIPTSVEELGNITMANRFNWSDSLLVNYAANDTGYLKFNRWMNHCIGGDKYAMRIFTADGKFIWENMDTIQLAFWPLVYDLTADGIDEILIVEPGHGKATLTILENRSSIQ